MAGHDPWSADDAEDGSDADDGERLRGWIHPDDRLWRHPSERGAGLRPAGEPRRTDEGAVATGRLGRHGAAPWLICGSLCIALVVAAAAVVVADTGEGTTDALVTAFPLAHSAPTTEPGPVDTAGWPLDTVADRVGPSTVALRVAHGRRVSTLVGVVAEAGGIVVTSARAIEGASRVTVVEPGGTREVAATVGIDPRSDLAVVRIPDDLPAASFADDDPAVGSVAMALAARPRPHSPLRSLLYAGVVVSSGGTMFGDSATATFATTTVRMPLGSDDVGCPLVDDGGQVLGLLDTTVRAGSSDVAVFLPGALVAGVARQLVSSGDVDRNWLGVTGSTTEAPTVSTAAATSTVPSSSGGAVLATVAKGSPAAVAGLEPGDVVTAVDGAPVHSMAELVTRLYPYLPGTFVEVTYERAQVFETVEVQLGDRDAEPDSGGSLSP